MCCVFHEGSPWESYDRTTPNASLVVFIGFSPFYNFVSPCTWPTITSK